MIYDFHYDTTFAANVIKLVYFFPAQQDELPVITLTLISQKVDNVKFKSLDTPYKYEQILHVSTPNDN